MHTKEYNGIKIKFPGPDLHEDDIQSIMTDLQNQIEKIGDYPDRSLFFQNPQIFDGWWQLVKTIKKIEVWDAPEDNIEWEDRTETYVAYLLTMSALYRRYVNLLKLYFEGIQKWLADYGCWLQGDCISAETMEALFAEYDPIELSDINIYLPGINADSHNARHAVYNTLAGIFSVLQTLMDSGLQIVMNLEPSIEDYQKAIENDLREWNHSFGRNMLKNMKEELNRHFKRHPTDHNTPELWGEMLRADEDALKMAMRQQLTSCEDAKQEHWGEDMKKQMDENGELMRLIYSTCYTEELFDLKTADTAQQFISLLTPNNLQMFYEIIVRRSLIQCEIFPDLKIQYDKWLNRIGKQQMEDDDDDSGLGHDRKTKLDDIIQILQKGNWKLPATTENIVLLVNAIFGKDLSSVDEDDIPLCEKMWTLIEGGRGDRKMIVSANLAGFFADENLLNGTSTEISNELFGNVNMVNNVTDGKKNHRSNAFEEVIPFLTKYTNKIIRSI